MEIDERKEPGISGLVTGALIAARLTVSLLGFSISPGGLSGFRFRLDDSDSTRQVLAAGIGAMVTVTRAK
jgi:hypothetical protein